ncbi:MAG: hydrogenase maturation nickel metallochaperone HypA [Eubacteriales bacterium]
MHEYPITQQIIKLAEKHAVEAGASKVTKVELVVGDYSGFIGDSIQMYFDIISEGSLCEGAEIEIIRVKPKLKCESCGEIFERVIFSFECPKCAGQGGPTDIGKEFYIENIYVEQ